MLILEILRVLSHGLLELNLFIEANCKYVHDEIRLAETVEAIASSRLPKTKGLIYHVSWPELVCID